MVPVKIVRYFSNLLDRRITADYSRKAGWEFGLDEVLTYYGWLKEAFATVALILLQKAPYLKEEVARTKELLSAFDRRLARQFSSDWSP